MLELLPKAVRRKKRPNFKPEFKIRLARRASEPGVSVSMLAQENDINVNMLFKWRRQLREGLLDGVAHRQTMLPVSIVDENPASLPMITPSDMPSTVAERAETSSCGVIEIQIAGAVVRVNGAADLAALRAILDIFRS